MEARFIDFEWRTWAWSDSRSVSPAEIVEWPLQRSESFCRR